MPEAMGLLSLFVPSLVIADVRFPTFAGPQGTLRLVQGGKGWGAERGATPLSPLPTPRSPLIHIRIRPDVAEQRKRSQRLRRIHRALLALGLLPVRTIRLAEGSTFHYAGTVPASPSPSKHLLSTDATGKLHQGKHVYVADASVFRCLPALPHTLTLMANANRVGEQVLCSLGS